MTMLPRGDVRVSKHRNIFYTFLNLLCLLLSLFKNNFVTFFYYLSTIIFIIFFLTQFAKFLLIFFFIMLAMQMFNWLFFLYFKIIFSTFLSSSSDFVMIFIPFLNIFKHFFYTICIFIFFAEAANFFLSPIRFSWSTTRKKRDQHTLRE